MSDTALVEVACAVMARLRERSLAGAADDEALRESVAGLQCCETMLFAEKLRRLHEVDAREAFRAGRQRSTADWLAHAAGLSGSEARRQVGVADALSRLPNTADRLASGPITPGHAEAAAPTPPSCRKPAPGGV